MSSPKQDVHVGESVYYVTTGKDSGEKATTFTFPVPQDERTVTDLTAELVKELEIMEDEEDKTSSCIQSSYELRHSSGVGHETVLNPESKARDVLHSQDRVTLCKRREDSSLLVSILFFTISRSKKEE